GGAVPRALVVRHRNDARRGRRLLPWSLTDDHRRRSNWPLRSVPGLERSVARPPPHLAVRDTRAPQPRPCSRILAVGAADIVRDGEGSMPVGAVGIGLVRQLAT